MPSNWKDELAFSMPAAFTPNGDQVAGSYGLSKREYAAILILQGLLAFPGYSGKPTARGAAYRQSVVKQAAEYADLLAAELNREETF